MVDVLLADLAGRDFAAAPSITEHVGLNAEQCRRFALVKPIRPAGNLASSARSRSTVDAMIESMSGRRSARSAASSFT